MDKFKDRKLNKEIKKFTKKAWQTKKNQSMTDIKNKVQNLDPNVKARNIKDMVRPTGNMFEALVAISKGPIKSATSWRESCTPSWRNFLSHQIPLKRFTKNKEQIEISKFYERLPNLAIIATEEYLNGELVMKYRDEENAWYFNDRAESTQDSSGNYRKHCSL